MKPQMEFLRVSRIWMCFSAKLYMMNCPVGNGYFKLTNFDDLPLNAKQCQIISNIGRSYFVVSVGPNENKPFITSIVDDWLSKACFALFAISVIISFENAPLFWIILTAISMTCCKWYSMDSIVGWLLMLMYTDLFRQKSTKRRISVNDQNAKPWLNESIMMREHF